MTNPSDHKDVLFIALVRTTYGFALYEVTRVTATRAYGRRFKGDEERHMSYVGNFVDIDKVMVRNATLDHYRAAVKAREAYNRALAAAADDYERNLADISRQADK